jgi:hypothetical protein
MNIAPLKNYGFNYTHNGSNFAFDVAAHSEEDARAKVAAMSSSEFFGELKESTCAKAPVTSSPPLESSSSTGIP